MVYYGEETANAGSFEMTSPSSPMPQNSNTQNQMNFWQQGAMGLNPLRRRHNVAAPTGYRVYHTKKGQPYLARETVTLENVNVEDEHARSTLGIFCSWKALEDEFGLSVRIYFNTCIMIILINVVFCILQLVNILGFYIDSIISFARKENSQFYPEGADLGSVLFASGYPGKLVWMWRATNIICIAISFLLGPFYWLLVWYSFKRRNLEDVEEHFAHDEDNYIPENDKIGKFNRFGRYLLSYTIYFLLLLIQIVILTVLTVVQNFSALYRTGNTGVGAKISSLSIYYILLSFAISIVCSILNIIYAELSVLLTNFEKARTQTVKRAHTIFKLMLFKLLTLTILGFIKGFFAASCLITELGTTYLIQIVTDLAMSIIFDWVVPWVVYKLKMRFLKKHTKGSDEDMRPDFDVAEEYIEIIYRQHIIYSGMPAFPGIPFIALFTNVLNLLLDKARLLKVCRRPPKTMGSFKTPIAFFMMLSAILVAINWGGGNIYTLIGFYWCNPDSSDPNASCLPSQCRIMANGTLGAGFMPSASTKLFPWLYNTVRNATQNSTST